MKKSRFLSIMLALAMLFAIAPATCVNPFIPTAQAATAVTKNGSKKIKKLTASPSKVTLKVGATKAIKIKFSPTNASNKKLKWSSSSKSIASVSSSGVISAKKVGSCTITAQAKDGSGKKVTIKVTVKPTGSLSLYEKEKKTIDPVLPAEDGKTPSVKWTSSNKSIATVAGNGVVTGKKEGSCYITVKASSGSTVYGMYKVTVKKGNVITKTVVKEVEIPAKEPCSEEEAEKNGLIQTWTLEDGKQPIMKKGHVLLGGAPGRKRETYEVTYVNGKKSSETLISSEVIREPEEGIWYYEMEYFPVYFDMSSYTSYKGTRNAIFDKWAKRWALTMAWNETPNHTSRSSRFSESIGYGTYPNDAAAKADLLDYLAINHVRNMCLSKYYGAGAVRLVKKSSTGLISYYYAAVFGSGNTYEQTFPIGKFNTESELLQWNDKGPWVHPDENGYTQACDPMNDFEILMIDF